MLQSAYINEKVFTSSYYNIETQKFEFFFQKVQIEFLTCAEELKSH